MLAVLEFVDHKNEVSLRVLTILCIVSAIIFIKPLLYIDSFILAYSLASYVFVTHTQLFFLTHPHFALSISIHAFSSAFIQYLTFLSIVQHFSIFYCSLPDIYS